RPRPDLIAGKTNVLAGLGRPERVLVDARSEAEFHGRDVRAARGGHIPGARRVEWTQNLHRGSVPVWRSAGELAALYETAGVTPDKEVLTYCQTHSRASHTYFTLRLLGYRRLKAYLGSWEEWGNDPALPVE
ncbi:MAG TPA: rhodanese-like domain-containing protein, partial [Candidatus Methylomirabilis sp.]